MSVTADKEIPVYKESFLKVAQDHELFYTEAGNPKGRPVFVIHGGPGGLNKPKYRSYFNPAKWRIIQMDQRGCGKSKFSNLTQNNTTWELVEDIERLRTHLGLDKFGLVGISWGANLALLYSIKYSKYVKFVVNRSQFDNLSAHWSFIEPVGKFFYPERWDQLLDILDEQDRKNPLAGYLKYVFGSNTKMVREATFRWSVWERTLDRISGKINFTIDDITDDDIQAMKVLLYYYQNDLFMKDYDIVKQAATLPAQLPVKIIHGRYDLYDPLLHTQRLARNIKGAELIICELAGHNTEDPGIKEAVTQAIQGFETI